MKEINVKLFNLNEIKNYFFEKKLKNIILFSQARSGSTFVSNILSKELGLVKNFFPEEFSGNRSYNRETLKRVRIFFGNMSSSCL